MPLFMPSAVVISAPLPEYDTLDTEALKKMVVAQHNQLLEQQQQASQQMEQAGRQIEQAGGSRLSI